MSLPANCEGRSPVPQSLIDDGHFVGQMMVRGKLPKGANHEVGEGQALGRGVAHVVIQEREEMASVKFKIRGR